GWVAVKIAPAVSKCQARLDTSENHVIMPPMFQIETNILAVFEVSLGRRAIQLLLFCMAILCSAGAVAVAQKIEADKLPMYGQPGIERPENLKKADETFVRDTALNSANAWPVVGRWPLKGGSRCEAATWILPWSASTNPGC